jgi:hypothetical protein
LTGEGIESAYNNTNNVKLATPEIVKGLKDKGLSPSDTRKWLSDNGYTIPKKAAGTPPDTESTDAGTKTASSGVAPTGYAPIDEAVAAQALGVQKLQQDKAAMNAVENQRNAAAKKQAAITDLSSKRNEIDGKIKRFVADQSWINSHPNGDLAGVQSSHWDMSPSDRAKEISKLAPQLKALDAQLASLQQ